MRIVIQMPESQVEKVDSVAERLGLRRSDAVRYLLTYGLTQEQFRGASCDSARASLLLANHAVQEMDAAFSFDLGMGEERDRVLVTPGLQSKSAPKKNGKGGKGR